MSNINKIFRKQIYQLSINNVAKKELYNLLKYVDLTIEKDFSIKNYNVVVNDYTEINLDEVVNLIRNIFNRKLKDININIRAENCFSENFMNKDEIYIIKSKKESFEYIEEKFKNFYWIMDLNVGTLQQMNKEILNNLIRKNNFIMENLTMIDLLSKQNIDIAKKSLLLACSKANKMNSNIIKDTYFNELLMDNKMLNSLKKLENLIGLKNTKQTLIEIINYLKLQKTKNKVPMLHMFFLGNPGTGKTTVARIFGEILSSLKILSNKEIFVEVTRADLIGRHIGETEEKAMKMIEKATGGILFIDEAYSLYSDKYSRDYGQNVVNILIREMESRRDKLCVIYAGYTKEMKKFIEMNSGFKSRVNFVIDFEDYTEEELFQIFEKIIKEEKLFLNDNCKNRLKDYFSDIMKVKNFGNGREMRNIAEQLKIIQANRIMKKSDFVNLNEIVLEDIDVLIKRNANKYKIEEKRGIGFL